MGRGSCIMQHGKGFMHNATLLKLLRSTSLHNDMCIVERTPAHVPIYETVSENIYPLLIL